MDVLTWDRHFATGVDGLDRQRRELTRLVSKLCIPSARKGEMAQAFDGLMERLRHCFSDEESLMASQVLDAGHRDSHSRRHREFLEQLASLRPDNEVLPASAELLRDFVAAWLRVHFLSQDKDMALRLSKKPAAPEAPLADGQLAPAVDRLAQLQGRLNRDLAEANRNLADKLAQRTRALSDARNRLESEQAEMTALLGKVEEAQRAVIHTEKMAAVGQLAAGISHEINNPVGFVLSNFNTLEVYVERLIQLVTVHERFQPASGPGAEALAAARYAADYDYLCDDMRELMKESRDGLVRIRRIVQNLKDFSHVDESEWQEVDINTGIASALALVNEEVSGKLEVVRQLETLPLVHCIPAQVNQVVLNLLYNAIQSLTPGGRITLRSGAQRDWVWFEVEDTGRGMEAEVKRRIFEPFYTTRPVGQGTGLGLSLAWDIIVQRHGGSFDVTSEPGVGTTVRVWLPVARPVKGVES